MTQKTDTKTDTKTDAKPDEPSGEKVRKERVLHTRIPAVLEHELKALAGNLRVPVSNLVRTILQDALEAAEMVGRVAEEELRGAADRLAKERDRLGSAAAAQGTALGNKIAGRGGKAHAKPAADVADADSQTESTAAASPAPDAETTDAEKPDVLDGVIGFQELLLAVATACARCGAALKQGEPAYLGVRDGPGPRVILGPECLPK